MATKKGVNKKKMPPINLERFALSGGIFTFILYLILGILGKLNIIGLTFLFDLYSKIGFDITIFGLILGSIYGFITGFLLFGLFAIIYNLMPGKAKN